MTRQLTLTTTLAKHFMTVAAASVEVKDSADVDPVLAIDSFDNFAEAIAKKLISKIAPLHLAHCPKRSAWGGTRPQHRNTGPHRAEPDSDSQRRNAMKTFMVEREIGETQPADLMGMWSKSLRVAGQMIEDGDRIYYLGSTYLPTDGLCLCLFSAKCAEVVANHSRIAHLPVRRIADAVTFGTSAIPGDARLNPRTDGLT